MLYVYVTCICYLYMLNTETEWYMLFRSRGPKDRGISKQHISGPRLRCINRNIKRSLYCQYGLYSLTFRALALRQREKRFFSLTKGQCSKRLTILSVLAVHRPFYISICISTLPTQHTTYISVKVYNRTHHTDGVSHVSRLVLLFSCPKNPSITYLQIWPADVSIAKPTFNLIFFSLYFCPRKNILSYASKTNNKELWQYLF